MKKLIVAAGLLAGASAFAAVYNVSPDAGEWTAGSLFDAAKNKATQPGDVIHLACGTYKFNTANGGELIVKPGVTIIGGSDDPADTVIERVKSGDNDRVLHLGRNATARNLTVRGGYTDYQAAGVLGFDTVVHKEFFVSNCIIENAKAKYKGGGSYGGTWRNCIIRGCVVFNAVSADLRMEGCGGGVYGGTLYDCVLSNNCSAVYGGAVGGSAADPLVAVNCLIKGNQAPYGGGAGVDDDHSGWGPSCCRLEGCTLEGNSAIPSETEVGKNWGGRGGGAYNCLLTNCTVRANAAFCYTSTSDSIYGGGGCAASVAVDCAFLENRATANGENGWKTCGGAAADSTLERCRISGNTAVAYGGGVLRGTTVDCWLSENSAMTGGAAINGVYQSCVFSNNVTTAGEGAAVYNGKTYNCLVIHNTSKVSAVLMRGYHQGDLIVENVSEGPGAWSKGSAIAPRDAYSLPGCDVAAVNCTVVGNRGGEGGIYAAYATNCLAYANVNMNGVGYDFRYPTLGIHNSVWATGDAPAKNSVNCKIITDPMFVQNPGRKECAYSLRPGSPCVDAGLNFAWMDGAKDLLGNRRIRGNGVDVGALENATEGISIFVR